VFFVEEDWKLGLDRHDLSFLEVWFVAYFSRSSSRSSYDREDGTACACADEVGKSSSSSSPFVLGAGGRHATELGEMSEKGSGEGGGKALLFCRREVFFDLGSDPLDSGPSWVGICATLAVVRVAMELLEALAHRRESRRCRLALCSRMADLLAVPAGMFVADAG